MNRVKRLSLEALTPYLLDSSLYPEADDPAETSPSAAPLLLDWRDVFGTDNPVEIEVGFGKGMFLVTSALDRPEVNFVGIEIARKYQLSTATRLAKRELHNVRVGKADAREFLRDHVATSSIAAVHVYFPDPWWKTRHRKRRVFTQAFASECARVIRPSGRLLLATDVHDYFHVMTELVARFPAFRACPQPDEAPAIGGITNFECKYRAEGRPIYRRQYDRLTE